MPNSIGTLMGEKEHWELAPSGAVQMHNWMVFFLNTKYTNQWKYTKCQIPNDAYENWEDLNFRELVMVNNGWKKRKKGKKNYYFADISKQKPTNCQMNEEKKA